MAPGGGLNYRGGRKSLWRGRTFSLPVSVRNSLKATALNIAVRFVTLYDRHATCRIRVLLLSDSTTLCYTASSSSRFFFSEDGNRFPIVVVEDEESDGMREVDWCCRFYIETKQMVFVAGDYQRRVALHSCRKLKNKFCLTLSGCVAEILQRHRQFTRQFFSHSYISSTTSSLVCFFIVRTTNRLHRFI